MYHSSEDVDVVLSNEMKNVSHKQIGAVIFLGPFNSIKYGTGTLISENIVLICIHAIYNK